MPKKYRIYCQTESANVFVIADTAPTTCPNNAGHTINSNSINVSDPLYTTSDIFGNGADGDVTISSNTSLSADMYYRNLTITSSAVLSPNGYRIFVSDTLTINNGSINANGPAGSAPNGGSAPYTAAMLGTGTSGGAGQKTQGSAGTAQTANTLMGGVGGSGGRGFSATVSTGGTGSAPTAANGGQKSWNVAYQAILGRSISGVQLNGGTGGAGGNGDNSSFNGGGGGAGGGVVVISARKIVGLNSATISANGGNGSGSGAVNTGGGGGGGGGVIVIVSNTDVRNSSTGVTISVTGGTPGSSPSSFAGTAGSDGSLFIHTI